ncbi:MAG TPA: hypothetical protein VFX98_09645 [Longimicrobiaceae bacterium]|nr:hypothetical protein [Longimicrobiaceae bacterium]
MVSSAPCGPADNDRARLMTHPYLATGALAACVLLTSLALEALTLPPAGRIAVGLVPVLAAAYVVRVMARWVRGLDELERKIVAESLALAYGAAILLAVGANYLDKIDIRVPLGWEDGWMILMFLYLAAYALTSRRYQ